MPIAKGEPSDEYPYPWLVYPWLKGEDLEHSDVDNLDQLARDLAGFVLALQQVDTSDAPAFHWGLHTDHEKARPAIRQLEGMFDVNRLTAVLDAALNADKWSKPPVWVHNDLLPGNVIVRNGRLTGLIDWGVAGVGDPAPTR